MKRINIFKPGKHTDSSGQVINFSAADLQAAAAAYDPAIHEAPLCVGHPKHDLPAYGWVKSLSFADDNLDAAPDQVDADFAELVKAGRIKKISPSFYLPNAANNPVPGVYYLRHVAFLGAQPPAVKGLRNIEFAAGDEGTVTIEFGDWNDRVIARVLRKLKNAWIEKFGKDEADKLIDEWDLEAIQEEALRPELVAEINPVYIEGAKEMLTPEQIKKQAELAAREAKLKKEEADFSEGETTRRRAADVEYAAKLFKEGKLCPGEDKFVAEFLEALESPAEATVSFGEGGKKVSLRAGFCQFLEARAAHPLFKSMIPPADEKKATDFSEAEATATRIAEYAAR